MPIYEYECQRCRSQFEQRCGFHDDLSISCPKCQGEARQLFTPVPVIFKGSGFYTTDHRAPEPKCSEGEKSNGESDSADSKE